VEGRRLKDVLARAGLRRALEIGSTALTARLDARFREERAGVEGIG
jgi:hypothetical protein